jgi:hypothetical protein
MEGAAAYLYGPRQAEVVRIALTLSFPRTRVIHRAVCLLHHHNKD